MPESYKALIITTLKDHSRWFFADSCVQYAYLNQTDQEFTQSVSGSYDVVYIRDPFNDSMVSINTIKDRIRQLRLQHPDAYYVDNVDSFKKTLLEDKWHQYQLFSNHMPYTRLAGRNVTVGDKHVAKKRISSRSKGVIFDAGQVELTDEWIVQDRLRIDQEFRVFIVNGVVHPRATIRSSKSATTKTEAIGTRELTDNERDFAQMITSQIPELDFVGLDIAISRGKLVLIEINRSPQFTKHNQIEGINIVDGFLSQLFRNNKR